MVLLLEAVRLENARHRRDDVDDEALVHTGGQLGANQIDDPLDRQHRRIALKGFFRLLLWLLTSAKSLLLYVFPRPAPKLLRMGEENNTCPEMLMAETGEGKETSKFVLKIVATKSISGHGK